MPHNFIQALWHYGALIWKAENRGETHLPKPGGGRLGVLQIPALEGWLGPKLHGVVVVVGVRVVAIAIVVVVVVFHRVVSILAGMAGGIALARCRKNEVPYDCAGGAKRQMHSNMLTSDNDMHANPVSFLHNLVSKAHT